MAEAYAAVPNSCLGICLLRLDPSHSLAGGEPYPVDLDAGLFGKGVEHLSSKLLVEGGVGGDSLRALSLSRCDSERKGEEKQY